MASTVPLSAVPASHTSRCVMPGRYHPAGVIGECPERDVAETIQAEILAMPDPSAVVEELPRIRRS